MDKCRICGTELSPSNRDPCPKCGGTIRVLDLAVSDGFVIRDSISGTHKQKWSGESLTLFFGIVAILLTIVSLGIINLLPFKQFEVALNVSLRYNNIFTLDMEKQTLTPGESFFRSFNLTALRVVLTLLIEGLIFFLFGYRQKRSWLVFLIVNLVTQGFLNVWLTVSTSPMQSYLVLSLIWGEFLVFIVETAAFLILVKEHRRWRTFAYVITANLVSLFAGSWLIMFLPV